MSAANSQHPGVPRVGIVADDLTGACDCGIEFVTCSKSVVVVLDIGCQAPAGAEGGVIVYNTQSRNLAPEEAHDKTFEATRRALSAGANLILKKVDSALRGNFGVEVAAVMDAAAAPLAFLLPAIPDAGRETIGGIQHIGGIPIAESFYADDPEHPVTESSVLLRAEEGSGRKAGLISLQDVRAGKTAEAAARLQNLGCQLIVVDARLAGDLHRAVKVLVEVTQPGVFVGCQGLAQALAAQLPAVGELPCTLERPKGATLFVCGTRHPQSRRQLDVAAESGELELVEIEASCLAESPESNPAPEELVKTCQRELLAGHNVGVCVHGKVTESRAEFCDSILAFLSNLSRQLVESVPLAALVLTGGETAYSVCRALDIRALKLHARIAPLVVASKAVGEPCHGMIVVAKGGSIGPDDLVSKIHESLRSGK